ncbi:MAG TPA: succinate dehydrogenase, hydrophobic membrane anchor protein [Gallionella sp.]|nr:succinate dehydrogenase, hydrophobic membrane anchor protein [Gallionella sp.]
MVNRIVTGAHYGVREWLIQRVTAVVIATYVVAAGGYLLLQPRLDYDVWTHLFTGQLMRLITLFVLLSVFYHAWIGVRNVVMDYIRADGARLVIHVLVILALLLYSLWSVQILWGVR